MSCKSCDNCPWMSLASDVLSHSPTLKCGNSSIDLHIQYTHLYEPCTSVMTTCSRYVYSSENLHNSVLFLSLSLSVCVLLLVFLCSPKQHSLHDLVEYIYAVTYRPFKPYSPPKFMARSVHHMCVTWW